VKQCSHCGAVLLVEDVEAAKCSRCGTLLPFDSDDPSAAARSKLDVLDQLPASVRHLLNGLSSRPPESDSDGPSSFSPISGYPGGGVVIRTVEPGPPPGVKLPSSGPPRRPSSRPPPAIGRPNTDPSASVDLLVHLPPPGFDGPTEDPNLTFDLPPGFSPEQLGVSGGRRDLAAIQAEALRRSLRAPALKQRERKLNVGQLVIAFLLLVLLGVALYMYHLHLNGEL
jgi:hypothetical protein